MRGVGQTSENPSVYVALSHFCPIITHSSIRRTIPVAFILYKFSFLTKAPLPKGGWRREATGGYNFPPPQAVPLPLGEGGFISQNFQIVILLSVKQGDLY